MQRYEITDGFGFDHLRKIERPKPLPGPGEVLVQVAAVSLNYRDLLVVRGHYDPRMSLPRVPVSDGAGTVIAIGEGVETVNEGDRVCGCFFQSWTAGEIDHAATTTTLGGSVDGMLSELVLLKEAGVIPVPAGLSFQEAATLPCAAVTAWNALTGGTLRPGGTVAVLGTGGVSVFACQFASAMGCRVIATSSSDAKLAKMKSLGADALINYRDNENWGAEIRNHSGGAGADLVVEVGGAGTLPQSLRAVRHGGEIALIGVLTGGAGEFNPLPAVMKAVRMRGIFVGSRAMFGEMNRLIEAADLRPQIDRVFGFDQAVEALEYLESAAHFGKVVIDVVAD